ncbi:MAG: hypothetical protein GY870_19725 [archaeon]|nr:hypothetical protein [archaeon]
MLEDSINFVCMIIEIIIFIILAMKIYNAQKNLLNQIFCTLYISWAGVIGIYCIIWFLGANSELWFIIANLLRDLQMILGMICAFLIFLSSQVVLHGVLGVKENPNFIYKVLVICIIAGIILVIVDYLVITDLDGVVLTNPTWENPELLRAAPNKSLESFIMLMFPLLVYGLSNRFLISFTMKQEDKEKKIKMIYLIIGNSLITIGIIYTIVCRIIAWQNILSISLGHLFLLLSPVFILMSKIHKKKNE